jgi:hypothetical protein
MASTEHRDRLEDKLDNILEFLEKIYGRIKRMAVDQATFDSALAAYLADIQTGLDAIAAKLATEAPAVDLTNELQQITDAKTTFDAAVATDTAPLVTPPAV